MPTKIKTQPAKPKTVIEQIIDLVDRHIAVTDAILKDYSYATEEDMDLELKTANENLRESITEYEDDEPEELEGSERFNIAIEMLNKIDEDDFDVDSILQLLSNKEVDNQKLLKLMDREDVEEWARQQGYACIDLQGNQDKTDKLEAFLHKEIYPAFNDQQSFIFL